MQILLQANNAVVSSRLSSSPCPICRKPALRGEKCFPFCSTRCQQIDLNRWLGEGYSVTKLLDPEEFDDIPPDEPEYE